MRNLKVVQKRRTSSSLFPTTEGPHRVTYSLGDHGNLYMCCDGILYRFDLEEERSKPVHLCEKQEILNDVFQMQFIPTTGVIYLANENGSFLQFMLHGNEAEELFQSEQGITSFSVSSDSRFVAIVTKQNTMLLLTLPDLDTVSQIELCEGSNENVSETMPVKVVWRQDSHYFAVNYKDGKVHRIKIFDETGTLHSKIEDENPLKDCVLGWQPSGGLIAAVGETPHGTVISLFERNGLKRADFYPYEGKPEKYETLPVRDLAWNTSSEILVVLYANKIELWCRNNYVWMRKVTLVGPSGQATSSPKLAFVKWDQEHNNRLHAIDEDGVYATYDVAFTYSSGYTDGSAIVSTWNGPSFHLTPFRNSCCPPPQCLLQGTCEADVVSVVVPEFWSGFLTVSIDGVFTFWQYEAPCELKKVKAIKTSEPFSVAETHDWVWPTRNTICCVSNGSLILFELQNWDLEETTKEASIVIVSRNTGSNIVSTCLSAREKEDPTVLLQNDHGLVLKLDLAVQDSVPLCKFPTVCSELQTLTEAIIVGHEPLTRKLLLGWSKYSECEALILSNDCTSFCVFQNSVLFTTIQGTLEIRSLHYITKLMEKQMLGNEVKNGEETAAVATGQYSRKCEKGSLIVRCCLNQMLEPSLVLQVLPRGNLEIIYPRPLVVDAVKVIMREKENSTRFDKIMAALRRHRIDYRVLIDEMRALIKEEPEIRVEELLKTMIDQVKNSHSLVLLVTDLNQDYLDCILVIKNLLEAVLRENMESRMLHVEEAYLAAMAKLGLLEDALKSSLIQGEGENNRDIVQNRVKFLSFYCENPDILFDTALGTYDLSLASLVADCLGKDPKEYIPILDDFQSMLELKRRFKIDDKLRRYARAVISLVRDSRAEHSEIVKYMERHRLFTDVIDFLSRKLKFDEGGVVERSRDDMTLLLHVSQFSYGLYLDERGKLLEASILFRDAQSPQKAIECATKSGNWELALEVAYESGTPEEKLDSLYNEILSHLDEKQMFADAARLCELYIGDVKQAIYFWMKSRKWQHASTLCLKTASLGIQYRDETIKPKLLESCCEVKDTLQQVMDDIETKLERLRIVKQKKADRLADMGGTGDAFSDTESFLSGSSTSGSISSSNISGKSYRSGKNKRKLERKVYSLKEGSKYEDLGLIAHLWNVMEKIQQDLKPDVSYCIESLWKFGESDSALRLCGTLEKTLQVADKCILEVWSGPITDEILELKFRIAPLGWSTVFNKLVLHESSSKAVTSTK